MSTWLCVVICRQAYTFILHELKKKIKVKYEGSVQNINTKFNIILGKIIFMS